jgi:hypothetical protein
VGGFQSQNGGNYDAFLVELNPAGSALIYSTYLGGNGSDAATEVALDPSGNAYIAGYTLSTNFPLLNPFQAVSTDNYAAFMAKVVFNLLPANVGVTPSSGSGATQTFALQFSDPSGATNLTSVSALFNTSALTSGACVVTYVRAQNALSLLTDAGSAPGASLTPGSGTQQNSQCQLNGAGSSLSSAGNILTLNLAITFKDAFTGAKTSYLQATNPAGSTGWAPKGTWTVPAPAVVGVNAVSVAPASGSGLQQTFSLHYSDGAGASDLSTVWVWFNPTQPSAGVGPCIVYYGHTSNALYLINDAGSAWLSTSVGSSTTLANSQCSVNAASTSVSSSGSDLAITLPVTFAATYSGVKNVSLFAAGSAATSGWQTLGAWTVPAPIVTISTVSATPNSGTGFSQTFAFQFSDTAGATDISSVSILFNVSTATTNSCSVTFNRAQNTLALLTDSGAQPAGTITPGSGSQQNTQCTLGGATSSVSIAGNSLTLNLGLSFLSAFAGSKNVYLQATGTPGSTGWQQQGVWVVPAAVAGVNAVSASPASGTGLQQTFTLRYSDGAGATDLSTVWVWFNPTPASSSAKPCMIYLSRPSNTLYLINDAGSAWFSASVGSSANLANGQCAVNTASTSVSLSGSDLVSPCR